MVGHAQGLWFNEFEVVMRRWETLADADGAHGAQERAHLERNASVHLLGEKVYVEAQGGVAAGTVMDEVFAKFVDAEFRAEWDAGVTKWGEAMCPAMLERTDRQRRFDALLAMFTAAAASGKAGVIEPLVNIVVDQTHLRTPPRPSGGVDVEPLDPTTVDQRRCETGSWRAGGPAGCARGGDDRPRPPHRLRHRRRGHRPGTQTQIVHRLGP